MPESVEVWRKERIPDGEGGYVHDFPNEPAATYPGRYRTAGARELEIASQMSASVEGVITLPHDAEILDSDQLRRAGITYNVSGILRQTSELSAHLEVLVKKV